MDSRPLIARDPRFRAHASRSAHPERPERLDAIDAALAGVSGLCDVEPRPASDDEILRAHRREHLDWLRGQAGRIGRADSDTYLAADSVPVALLAAGATAELALRVARGDARRGFALVRPPGHHAEPDRAMGFCLVNNVAVAAGALRAEARLERIAIVDWDVHHGNGTQHLFETDRDVLFVSLHQFPLYPGTGALAETGRERGEGSTLNLPLPPGCGDAEYVPVFRNVVLPALREFRPEMILVSAGFDAHERDPLASMFVSTDGFRALAIAIRGLADDVCGGRLVLTLEGGYDLDALGASVAAVLEVLAAETLPEPPRVGRSGSAGVLEAAFREAHARHWEALRTPTRA